MHDNEIYAGQYSDNTLSQQRNSNAKYMYTEQLQLLKKMHAAKKMQC